MHEIYLKEGENENLSLLWLIKIYGFLKVRLNLYKKTNTSLQLHYNYSHNKNC